MSRPCKMGITVGFLAGFAVLATLFVVGHVEGAKPLPPISLQASFEEFWVTDENQNEVNLYRMQNDDTYSPYVDTPDRKVGKTVVKSGVEVKYYPPGGWDQIGRFKMILDETGFLHRYVQLHFLDPSTNPVCDESARPPYPVDPLSGGTGTLLTKTISITTWGVLIKGDAGYLVSDPDQPLDMDKMLTGDSKFVQLGITFNPAGTFSDRSYTLGILPGITWTGDVICPDKGYSLCGSAELYCAESGRAWEFRPHAASFLNAPDNVTRLLHTNVQIAYLESIMLRAWRMPFVLTVTRQ